VEINKDDATAPEYAQLFASPTILLDGKGIFSAAEGGDACRIYRNEDGSLTGIPSRRALEVALDEFQNRAIDTANKKSPQ